MSVVDEDHLLFAHEEDLIGIKSQARACALDQVKPVASHSRCMEVVRLLLMSELNQLIYRFTQRCSHYKERLLQ